MDSATLTMAQQTGRGKRPCVTQTVSSTSNVEMGLNGIILSFPGNDSLDWERTLCSNAEQVRLTSAQECISNDRCIVAKPPPPTSRRFWNPGLTACAGCLSIRWSSLSTYAQPCAATPCKREKRPTTQQATHYKKNQHYSAKPIRALAKGSGRRNLRKRAAGKKFEGILFDHQDVEHTAGGSQRVRVLSPVRAVVCL